MQMASPFEPLLLMYERGSGFSWTGRASSRWTSSAFPEAYAVSTSRMNRMRSWIRPNWTRWTG